MVVPAVVVSPIVAVLEQADLPVLESGDFAGTAGVALSLVEAFERVPDPRRARGIRHGLVPLLVVAACAVLTGARSFAAIGEYARDKGRLVLDTLGVDGAVAHSATSGGFWSTSPPPGCRRRSPPGAWPSSPPKTGPVGYAEPEAAVGDR